MVRAKLVMALLCAGLFVVGGGSVAQAQDDCPYGVACDSFPVTTPTTTSPTDIPIITVVRGQTIDVSGDDCAPGASVTVTYDDGTVLGTFPADDNGSFVATITIPASSTLGQHLVTATCGDVQQFVKVDVLSDGVSRAPDVSGGTLPRTGSSNTGPLVGIGAAAMVLGAAFIYGSRRPRQA